MISSEEFRHVLGHYTTGVTVVTAETPEGPVGMACNSMTAVSLDPPLVLLCAARTSSTWPLIEATGRFVVNVMADDQAEVAQNFSRKGADRFASVGTHRRENGIGIDDAIAWIECEIDTTHAAGDHTIVIGRVLCLEAPQDRNPLAFYRGKFGSFASSQ